MKHLWLLLFTLLTISVSAQPSVFESRGVGGGGALFANCFNPFNPNELYIACDMSELFHTTDLGKSWSFPDFRQIQSFKIAKVSFTNNGNTVYAIDGSTTPEGSDRSRPMRSTDKGITWTAITDPTDGSAYMIYAHPNNSSIILVSDYNTLYASVDGGVSFSSKYQTSNNNTGLHVAGVFFDGENIYVGTNEGIYFSIDGGNTFSKLSVSGIPSNEYILSFSAAKTASEVRFTCVTSASVWAGIDPVDNYYDYKGVYTLTAGNQWQKVSGSLPAGIYPYFCGMASNNTNIAYIAGASDASTPKIYKTTDAGTSWQSIFITSNNQNITTGWSGDGGDRAWTYGEYPMGFDVAASDANYVSFSDFGFVHISTDGGTTWKQKYVRSEQENASGAKTPQKLPYSSVGIENTTCWQVFWIDKDNMYGCFSDIRGIRSTDGGKSWGFNYSGHEDNSMYYLTKHISGNTLYAATSSVHDIYQSTYLTDARIDNGKGKVIFSNDNGASWQTLHDFQHPVVWLATDPQNQNRLYASVIHSAEGGIYVSNNIQNGTSSTWTKLAVPPRTEGHPFNIRVLNDGSLLCSYSGRRTNNFTASSGVFLSTDGGVSWLDRSDAGMHYWTKDVVIDPHDQLQNTWYAGVFSGWGGAANNKGGLYKTTNRGQSWQRIHNEMRVTSCTFNPTNPNIMFFTSETNGLYYCENRLSANPLFTQAASYPFRQPERVFYNPYDTNELWISSFGNGMKVGYIHSVEPTLPEEVTLLFPPNHSMPIVKVDELPPYMIQLDWNPVVSATKYNLQIAADSLMTQLVFEDSTSQTSQVFSADRDSTYWWRVRASNENGYGKWSEHWTFSKVTYLDVLDTRIHNQLTISHKPTPAADLVTFTIECNANIADASFTVSDATGKSVYSQSISLLNGVSEFSLDVKNFPNGIYYYRLTGRFDEKFGKLVISR